MEENETFQDKLRDIFDCYDEDHDGYIDVNHVQNVLTKEQFGSAQPQEITGIVNLLDPEGTGVISFDDFCEGVRQLAAIQSQVHSLGNSLSGSCSLETLVPIENFSPEPTIKDDSDTYGEYDISSFEEVSVTSLLESDNPPVNSLLLLPTTSEDDRDSAVSGRSSEINDNSRQEVTDEENYEDYGESEADVSDQGRLTPLTLRKSRGKKELLSRPHKRSRQVQSDSPYENNTRRSSFGSDIVYDDIDGSFQNIDDRMKYLESQILKLSDDQTHTHIALKKENTSLKSKVHDLETQLELMEVKTEERIQEERRREQDSALKLRREQSDMHLDYVTQRLQKVEKENEELKQELNSLRNELHRVRTEKLDLQDGYDSLSDDHHKLQTELHKTNQQINRERETTGQLLDELSKELDELRRYKMEQEVFPGRKHSLGDLPARYQDLQQELHTLKQENKVLKDSNEDLNAQLLNRCMEEGRSLLQDTAGTTLAEELEHLNKEELLERLKKEQEINLRLKQYVDKIILTIIDKNPSLLEITNN